MRLYLAMLSFWMSLCVTPKKIVTYLEKNCTNTRNNTEFITQEAVRVASVQMRVRGYKNLRDYLSEMLEAAQAAVDDGAQLVVFPEYAGTLTATLLPSFDRLLFWAMDGRMPESLEEVEISPERTALLAEAFQNYIYEAYAYTFSTIARLLHVYVAAGSSLFYEQGELHNRCVLFGPDGEPVGAQDKVSCLGFDKAIGVVPSDRLELFDTPLGRLAILLGTDGYYFETFKAAVELGARIVLVPDSRGGVTRDVLRCRANECGAYVVYACYAHPKKPGCRAGILGPMAVSPDHSGIFSGSANTKSDTVTCRLNLEKLDRFRREVEPNPDFLAGDYMHSYLYCGAMPVQGQDGQMEGKVLFLR